MTDGKPAAIRGLARVVFRANLATIRIELDQGWTAKAIFERHHAKLGAMSYRQFCRYVADELDRAGPSWAAQPAVEPARPPPPPCTSPQGSADAGHQQPPRSFEHDPVERPGDYERLFGESRQPKK